MQIARENSICVHYKSPAARKACNLPPLAKSEGPKQGGEGNRKKNGKKIDQRGANTAPSPFSNVENSLLGAWATQLRNGPPDWSTLKSPFMTSNPAEEANAKGNPNNGGKGKGKDSNAKPKGGGGKGSILG